MNAPLSLSLGPLFVDLDSVLWRPGKQQIGFHFCAPWERYCEPKCTLFLYFGRLGSVTIRPIELRDGYGAQWFPQPTPIVVQSARRRTTPTSDRASRTRGRDTDG